jgi:hypothetical protein
MRRFGRTDGNHADVVAALRKIGATVRSLASLGDGMPDLAVGYQKRNFFLEVKDSRQPPSKQKLTDDEQDFFDTWRGQVSIVRTPEEAVNLILELRRGDGA